MKKIIWRTLGLAIVIALVVAAIWAFRPTPIPVDTAAVTRSSLTATVVAEGRTRVKDLYVVAAAVDGDLERIALEPGDTVVPGSTIARIWPVTPRPLDVRTRAEAEAAVVVARAAVAQAEANQREASTALAHAESLSATARVLSSRGAAPKNESEHAEHEAQIRRDAVNAAQAAVQTARADLQRAEATVATAPARATRPATVISSPVKGRVLRVLHQSAGPVVAGTPLAEIGNIADVEVVSDLLTSDAMQVHPGADATLRDWGGTGVIRARVRRVDPAAFTKVSALGVEEQRVPVVLDLVGPSPRGLGHDFRVTVSITVWRGENVLTAPSTALFRIADRWAVFTTHNGKAVVTQVTPGASDDNRTVIETGLTEGQRVVVQPSDRLDDGSRVTEHPQKP